MEFKSLFTLLIFIITILKTNLMSLSVSIEDRFISLSNKCPDLIKIDYAESRYGLPYNKNCTLSKSNCQTMMVLMTDFNTLKVNRPQIFISGEFDGSSTGPEVLFQFANYFCSISKGEVIPKDNWLNSYLTKRMFVITPLTNTYGYLNVKSNDILSDNLFSREKSPYYDFFFNMNSFFKMDSIDTSSQCIESMSVRALQKIFQEYIFSFSIFIENNNEQNNLIIPWKSREDEFYYDFLSKTWSDLTNKAQNVTYLSNKDESNIIYNYLLSVSQLGK